MCGLFVRFCVQTGVASFSLVAALNAADICITVSLHVISIRNRVKLGCRETMVETGFQSGTHQEYQNGMKQRSTLCLSCGISMAGSQSGSPYP